MGGAIAGGGIASAVQGSIQNYLSIKEAKKQRKFIKKMYQNRYQYQMDDMRKAGLNPILSYAQAPPSGPGGSIPNLVAADIAGGAAKGAAAGESAARTSRVGDEKELIKQQTTTSAAQGRAADATAANQSADATLKGFAMPKARAQHDLYMTPQGRDLMYGIEGNSAYGIPGRIRAMGEDIGKNWNRTTYKLYKGGPKPSSSGKSAAEGLMNLWKTFNTR